MMQDLPIGGFEWLDPNTIDLNNLEPCVLEVDLEYAKELFEEHKDYPLAPEVLEVGNKQNKLCQILFDKEKYVVHYKNLQYYLKKGLRVKKIHRAIKFKESSFLRSYIEKCIDLRKHSKTEMEKSVWKSMVNAVFGKTMENLGKRIHVEIVVGNEKRVQKLIVSPYFATADVIQPDNMVASKLNIKKILYDKPIYVRFSILELSKLWMFQMHYDFVKQRMPDSILMYTDTDSLIYYNPTESLEEFVKRLQDKLDILKYS